MQQLLQAKRPFRPLVAPSRTRAPALPRCLVASAEEDSSPDAFAAALLNELHAPDGCLSGSLRAATALHALAPEARVLALHTAEAPEDEEASSRAPGSGPPPWQSPLLQNSWAAALRANVASLLDLGFSPEEAGALVPAFPLLLLLEPGSVSASAAHFLQLGLTTAELRVLFRAAPRLLAFNPAEHLIPAFTYLQSCGMQLPAVLSLLRSSPALALGAIEHKVRTDRAAVALRAAYAQQGEERSAWAVETAAAARASMARGSM